MVFIYNNFICLQGYDIWNIKKKTSTKMYTAF